MIPVNTESRLFPKLSMSSPQHHNALSDLNLTTDEVVEGRVLKEVAPGDILLLIRGRTIRAHTRVPLKAGMHLSLKLSSETEVPTLKLLDVQQSRNRTVNLAAIRMALDDNVWGRVYDALDDAALPSKDRTAIKSLMENVSKMVLDRSGGEGLRALIDASGLTWENKLAQIVAGAGVTDAAMDALAHGDLKGLISKILMNSEDASAVLKPLITAMDNIQLLNVHGREDARSVFLPLPLHFAQGDMGVAQILLQFPLEEGRGAPEKETKEERQYAVVMLLELSTLGAIRAELLLTGKTVQGRFLVDKKETLECIETHLPSFSEMLQNRGFTISYMGCKLEAVDVVTKSPVNEIFPQEGSSICFVA